MAADRRLNPAELKARLQANLAVAGVKSSNPHSVAPTRPRENTQTSSEAAASLLEASDPIQVSARGQEPQKPTQSEREAPKSYEKPASEAPSDRSNAPVPNSVDSSTFEAPFARETSAGDRQITAGAAALEPALAVESGPATRPASAPTELVTQPAPISSPRMLPEQLHQTPLGPISASLRVPPGVPNPTGKPDREQLQTSGSEYTAEPSHEPIGLFSGSAQPKLPKSPTTTAVPETINAEQNTQSIFEEPRPSARTATFAPRKDQQYASEPSTQTSLTSGKTEAPKPSVRNVDRREESIPTPAFPAARKRIAPPEPLAPTKPSEQAVLHRRDRGAVLRGYRIPVDLHRQAERAKLGLASRRGSSLFWDELLQGAIDLLLDDTQRISNELSAARRTPELGSPNTRVLQAAIRNDQDLRLRMLRIDLEEIDGATVRLEEIWTWLIRQVVKNEG